MEEIILRKEPLFKMKILDEAFEISNAGNSDDNCKYVFSEIDSLRLGKRVNWFVTALSIITESILSGSAGIHKERDQLKFNYRNKPKKISLKGCNLNVARKSINKINQKIREDA